MFFKINLIWTGKIANRIDAEFRIRMKKYILFIIYYYIYYII